MPEPKKRDAKAPEFLEITIQAPNGKLWSKVIAKEKVFSTGSVGFYANDKASNPESGEKYQIGINITLIGSKP
ncbi:MAG: hypothetical protein JXB88_19525 [Spirochaetales bacterium]|nr:hypothetical protein [Spirochaetales bacterium]